MEVEAGAGTNLARGGIIDLPSGAATTGAGGDITIAVGDGPASTLDGGKVSITAGLSDGGEGGHVVFVGGAGGAAGLAGFASAGGDVEIEGGATTTNTGGAIELVSGLGAGEAVLREDRPGHLAVALILGRH